MSVDVLTREFSTSTPVRLSVTTGAGSVQVDAVEGDRTVVTITPSSGRSDAGQEAMAGALIEQRGDQIVVEVPRRSVGFLRRGSDLAISVVLPAGSTAEILSDSATLRTTGILGAVSAKSGSGAVVIEHAGEVTVHTGSGDTDVTRADGPVRVRSGSGDVAVHAAAGGCSVGTGSGDIRVERADGPLQINTGSGDVTVDDAANDVAVSTASGDHHLARVRRGQVKASSASGDVHVGVLDGTAVWLDVTTVSGTVHSALDRGEAPPEDEESVTVRITTVSGDISLARA
jgi:hypothetical protein